LTKILLHAETCLAALKALVLISHCSIINNKLSSVPLASVKEDDEQDLEGTLTPADKDVAIARESMIRSYIEGLRVLFPDSGQLKVPDRALASTCPSYCDTTTSRDDNKLKW
jgi:hypothetical protein